MLSASHGVSQQILFHDPMSEGLLFASLDRLEMETREVKIFAEPQSKDMTMPGLQPWSDVFQSIDVNHPHACGTLETWRSHPSIHSLEPCLLGTYDAPGALPVTRNTVGE